MGLQKRLEEEPWKGKQTKGERWKLEKKNLYSSEEYKELDIGGPLKEPKYAAQALDQYEDWPSRQAFIKLWTLYHDIPKDERHYCLGNMDEKDHPIREALGL